MFGVTIPRLEGVTYAGSGPAPKGPSPGPGGNEYGGEWEKPVTNPAGNVQAIIQQIQARGLPPTIENVNRVRAQAPQRLPTPPPDRTVEPYEPNTSSAPPTSASPDLPMLPDAMSMTPGGAGSAAALGAGGVGLGALILRMLGLGRTPPVAGAPTPLALPAPEMSPRIGGPAPQAQVSGPETQLRLGNEPGLAVAGPDPGAPRLNAPAERPAIPLPSVPTGNPPIPLKGPSAPPQVAPSGPGFEAEYGSRVEPPSPASAAIDKALEGSPAPVRAKSPRAKAPRVRVPRVY
jgi:hypothetical protein